MEAQVYSRMLLTLMKELLTKNHVAIHCIVAFVSVITPFKKY